MDKLDEKLAELEEKIIQLLHQNDLIMMEALIDERFIFIRNCLDSNPEKIKRENLHQKCKHFDALFLAAVKTKSAEISEQLSGIEKTKRYLNV